MLSFIKFRIPALHDNFFESLWMWYFQLRFSSRVTPRNLASLTCSITTLLIFRHRLESGITFLSGLKSMKQHFDMLIWSLFTSIDRWTALRILFAFSYASMLLLASTKIFVSSANNTNSALLLIFGRPLI